ncbi:MAG: hypothetical protein KIT48_13185 [Pseudolabrys sp.]|nr:hypothetical protein [Pseudolabrys sp.]
MTTDDEVGRGRDADTMAFFALIRRLYVEVASISGHGDAWIRAMEEQVVKDVRRMSAAAPGKMINPATIDQACDTVTKALTGLRSTR